ncbi:hypothetical protein [Achromobacter spanius]|uniref:hypothetical protein n=1 Tax=Achromobacter spanius TaxID=217203 RepID=UPI003A8CFCA0
MSKGKEGFGSAYIAAFDLACRYVRAYGGIWAMVRSPYLHLSVLLTVLSFNVWTQPGWWERPIAVLPSLLGFSLGGFAVWLASGDDAFRAALAGRVAKVENGEVKQEDKHSPYLAVSATFTHFVVVQVLSLLYALTCMSLNFTLDDDALLLKYISRAQLERGTEVGGGIGYWLFLYSLILALAAVLGLFRISSWYDTNISNRRLLAARRKVAEEDSPTAAHSGPEAANDEPSKTTT